MKRLLYIFTGLLLMCVCMNEQADAYAVVTGNHPGNSTRSISKEHSRCLVLLQVEKKIKNGKIFNEKYISRKRNVGRYVNIGTANQGG
jgi:hypothetical protein